MKTLYWRPQKISRKVLLIVALISVAGILSVEMFRVKEQQEFYKEKVQAARLARRAFEVIKEERLRRGIPIESEADPSLSGLIGALLTDTTTNPGHLPAKQTTINPNFAAVIVHYLKRIGVEPGDTVTVGLSGSFPAMNVNVLAALETLKLQPIVISSVGASQWGANLPQFLWPDMEHTLYDQRVISFRSVAASLGGIEDRALGLSNRGRQLIEGAIIRNNLRFIQEPTADESLERRMIVYREHAAGAEVKAYINVGGGTTSVGTKVGKRLFRPGLNRFPPPGTSMIDSVMTRFSVVGVPVIHMTKIDTIAERYGLPLQPVIIPAVGEGKIFIREEYNTYLAAGLLGVILLLLWVLIRLDWGYRVFSAGRRATPASHPEPMV